MIVDSICVPGSISSIDGCVCAVSKVLEEPGFTNHTSLTFKSAFTSSILSFIPVFREFFFVQKTHPYRQDISIRNIGKPFEKFCWAGVVV